MARTLRSIETALEKTERGYNMVMSDEDLPARDQWARPRFAIIGELLASPPAEGELQGAWEALAARAWRHPFTGLDIRFGTSTIQRWYYAARRAADPVSVLRNQIRQDIGRFPSFSAEAATALRALYAEHRGWNAASSRQSACEVGTARHRLLSVLSERAALSEGAWPAAPATPAA